MGRYKVDPITGELTLMNPSMSDIPIYQGVSGSTASVSGLVPQAQAGDEEKALLGNGTWGTVAGGGQTISYADWLQLTPEEQAHGEYFIPDYSGSILPTGGFDNVPTAGSQNPVTSNGIYYHYVTAGAAEGSTIGEKATAEGYDNRAYGNASHAEGSNCIASGTYSHAEGSHTTAATLDSHAGGAYTSANTYQTVVGSYNTPKAHSDGTASSANSRFIVGIGSSSGKANGFRVALNACYSKGAVQTSGADYAEMFEWKDGNPNNEDRCGFFVELDADKIAKTTEVNKVLGVVSGNPSFAGDVYDDDWQGKFLTDVFGRPLWEEIEVPEEVDEEGNVIVEAHTEMAFKPNPDYDPTKEYIPRSQRPEWDYIGMLGKLVVIDDGSCVVNGYCKPNEDSIATNSNEVTKFRVMKRLDATHVMILIL